MSDVSESVPVSPTRPHSAPLIPSHFQPLLESKHLSCKLSLSGLQQISSSESALTGKGSPNDGRGERERGESGEKKIIGVVQLAFAYLFEQIKLRKNRSLFYIIHVSYLEVYNEQVMP